MKLKNIYHKQQEWVLASRLAPISKTKQILYELLLMISIEPFCNCHISHHMRLYAHNISRIGHRGHTQASYQV